MRDLDEHLPAIVAGDSAAFARWLAEAEAPLRRSLGSFAARVDTEAVLQESLLRVWQVAPKCTADGKGNSLLRLAVRIARNLAISETRKARTDPAELDELERASTQVDLHEVRPPDPMLRRLITACRERLPPKPAAALTARLGAFGGVADLELADGLGMTKNTFLQNFGRARKLIAQCLRGHGVDLDAELS